ncbi:MAG: shikimate dehydrogenase [Syntrophaceae bacterium]|nr:shikimate dehydrogenase [Syntrophaceae bacterium]
MVKAETPGEAPRLFALFGNPVRQSLSPRMHNRAFRIMGIDGQYIPVLVEDLPGAVEAIRALNIRGVSVTIPFKETVVPLLDEIDDNARRIGSVNTILNDKGKLTGFNTDWQGIEAALNKKMPLQGKSFVLIGSGGTTRAALYAIKKNGGEAVIVSRNQHTGEALAAEFDSRWVDLSQLGHIPGDCLINTTPVGMTPRLDESPADKETVSRFRWVMDAVYNPPETRLLQIARESGALTISGVEMFIAQGAQQLRIWTGMEPPIRSMKAVVLAALKERNR